MNNSSYKQLFNKASQKKIRKNFDFEEDSQKEKNITLSYKNNVIL